MSADLTDYKSTLVQVMAWAVRQQAITWANNDPDLCRHVVSLGHNELRWLICESSGVRSMKKMLSYQKHTESI